jgi:hypothetical protein
MNHDRSMSNVQLVVKFISACVLSMLLISALKGAETLLPADDGHRHCTSDKLLCLSIRKLDNEDIYCLVADTAKSDSSNRDVQEFVVTCHTTGAERLSISPSIIRLPNAAKNTDRRQSALIGVIANYRAMYSGGSASSNHLCLRQLRFGRGLSAVDDGELLSVPWRAHKMIRACFSEDDMKHRNGACHD